MPQPVLTAEQRKRKPVRLKTSGATQAERDRLALGVIESFMDAQVGDWVNCPSCKKKHRFKEITPAVATLLRARYDKLRPTLSAVEQTVHDQRDTVDPAQVEAQLRALYDAKPELFSFVKPAELSTVQTALAPASIAQEIGNKPVSH